MNPTLLAPEKAIRRGIFAYVFVVSLLLAFAAAVNFLADSIVHRQAAGEPGAQTGNVIESRIWPLRAVTMAFPLAALAEAVFAYRPLFRRLNGLRKELHASARADALTGCLNRRAFAEEAGRLFARARREQSGMAVLIVNADHFGKINNAHGHHARDLVISGLAGALLRNIREMDIPGRMSGDEFAVVLPESGLVASMLVAQRFRRAVAGERVQTRGTGSVPISITVSIGVVVLEQSDATFFETLDHAYNALRLAKQNGRDRVETVDNATASEPILVEPGPNPQAHQAGSPSGGAGGRGVPSSGAGSKGIGVKG
jgi:diguanylate cyclase (GGDEF)-like protein